ncbi:MAG TPA: stage II sporulation protein P [Thermaerobacter sp.]
MPRHAHRWTRPGRAGWMLILVAAIAAGAAAWWWRARLAGPELLQLGERPFVLVYHTHGTESFLPDLYGSRRAGRDPDRDAFTRDQRKSVRAAGQAIARRLYERGLDAVWLGTLYDEQGRDGAYARAREGMRRLLTRYPDIRVALDIHRDATSTRVPVGGTQAAGVLFVVGAGHPRWHQNLALAEAMAERLARVHPRLVRGIALKPWHYNQDLLPGALIVEIGGAENSLAETLTSARLVADALVDALAPRPGGPPAGSPKGPANPRGPASPPRSGNPPAPATP